MQPTRSAAQLVCHGRSPGCHGNGSSMHAFRRRQRHVFLVAAPCSKDRREEEGALPQRSEAREGRKGYGRKKCWSPRASGRGVRPTVLVSQSVSLRTSILGGSPVCTSATSVIYVVVPLAFLTASDHPLPCSLSSAVAVPIASSTIPDSFRHLRYIYSRSLEQVLYQHPHSTSHKRTKIR